MAVMADRKGSSGDSGTIPWNIRFKRGSKLLMHATCHRVAEKDKDNSDSSGAKSQQ